jgi:hypothetical protein
MSPAWSLFRSLRSIVLSSAWPAAARDGANAADFEFRKVNAVVSDHTIGLVRLRACRRLPRGVVRLALIWPVTSTRLPTIALSWLSAAFSSLYIEYVFGTLAEPAVPAGFAASAGVISARM